MCTNPCYFAGCVGALDPLNKAIRGLIRDMGWTVADAARESGTSRSHLSLALSGKRELSSPQWRRLLTALGIWEDILDSHVRTIQARRAYLAAAKKRNGRKT